MSFQEFEPTPPQGPAPIGRFYSDMLYKADSPADLIISAERFLVESRSITSELDATYAVSYELEVENGPQLSAEEIHDVCVTIPLRLAAWRVDDALDFAEAQAWYKKVIPNLKARMRKEHTLGCLDSPTFASHEGCEFSRQCPVIYTAKYLERDLFEQDFDTGKYNDNPYGAKKLAIEKENIALRYGFRTTAQAHGMIELFEENFEIAFHQE